LISVQSVICGVHRMTSSRMTLYWLVCGSVSGKYNEWTLSVYFTTEQYLANLRKGSRSFLAVDFLWNDLASASDADC